MSAAPARRAARPDGVRLVDPVRISTQAAQARAVTKDQWYVAGKRVGRSEVAWRWFAAGFGLASVAAGIGATLWGLS